PLPSLEKPSVARHVATGTASAEHSRQRSHSPAGPVPSFSHGLASIPINERRRPVRRVVSLSLRSFFRHDVRRWTLLLSGHLGAEENRGTQARRASRRRIPF